MAATAKRLVERIGPFTAIPNGFITSAACIPHSAFKLYCYLRFCVNTRSGSEDVFPSYNAIRKCTGLSRTSIQIGLNWLSGKDVKGEKDEPEHKWLTRRRRFNASTVYTLTVPAALVHLYGLEQSTKVDCISPQKRKLTTRMQLHEQQQQSSGMRGGGGELNEAEERLLSQLRECGVKRTKRTTDLVRRIVAFPHAEQVIQTQTALIAQDGNVRSKPALLLTTLESFNWNEYKPRSKVTYRAKDDA